MGEPIGSRAVLSSRTFCDDRSGLSVLSEMAVTGQIQILNTWNYIFNFVSVTFNAKSHMWLVATILDSTGVENEEQQVKFIMLFCGVIIPNQTFFFFFFFNLDHMSILHGPNRKQMAQAEEVFQEVYRDCFNHS